MEFLFFLAGVALGMNIGGMLIYYRLKKGHIPEAFSKYVELKKEVTK